MNKLEKDLRRLVVDSMKYGVHTALYAVEEAENLYLKGRVEACIGRIKEKNDKGHYEGKP